MLRFISRSKTIRNGRPKIVPKPIYSIRSQIPNIVPLRFYAKKKKAPITSLEATLKNIEKTYGAGTIINLKDKKYSDCETIPTGSLGLDIALGVGGLPKGRCVEIYGPESSGKTSLALSVVGQAQKAGGKCLFIDVEHAIDPSWARKLGVETESLLFSQPSSGEEALEIADTIVQTGQVDVVVVDSIAALVPRSELEGEMGDHHVGVQARLMSQALRKLTGSIAKSNTLLIFINQIRMKIGVLFGSPETTSGGLAVKFYSSIRLDIRRVTQIKDGENVTGNIVRVRVAKNKLGPPFRKAEFELDFKSGISKTGEILDLGTTYGLVNKSGSWYSYDDHKLGQGREKSKQYLEHNPDICDEIEAKLRDILSKEVQTEEELEEAQKELAVEAEEDILMQNEYDEPATDTQPNEPKIETNKEEDILIQNEYEPATESQPNNPKTETNNEEVDDVDEEEKDDDENILLEDIEKNHEEEEEEGKDIQN
uniref:Bacterial recombinase A n=1 Tax=Rhizamoeba saxonica TaxID=200886 RepID=A0A3G1FLK0_9EUKA|nr:bacterial recombinase A [Rhizamoeba saxonica]|eukprot:TRINITY_DN8496_c0_g1_i1.p1 TRINITY_DN8496_c0_g1~~TRINITY_DN8496_c0_g1_i1.p1  ORF type:complete len:482 (+),score=149.72 TRINITY_DN8496_c0_g1_i1:57-1502(+)